MAEAVGNKVKYLKRLKMWEYELGDLKPKEWRIIFW
jgi:16S rRNA U516 pseudouridylate synthase RsuA-like enzyme